MAREPDSDKVDRLTEILKKAKPAQQPAPPGRSLQAGRDIQYFENGARLSINSSGTKSNNQYLHRSIRRFLRLTCLGVVFIMVPLLFSVISTQQPQNTVIRPIAAIAVDRAPDIQPADVLIPTGPLTEAPYETCFEIHAGCAFFRAPRSVEPNIIAADNKSRDI